MTKTKIFQKYVLLRNAEKSLRRRTVYKKWKKRINKSQVGKHKEEKKKYSRHHRILHDYSHVVAPKNFSFRKNTRETISFINKLEDHFDKGKKVFVVLREVEVLDFDAIVLLLSKMIKFKAKKIDFNGDFPLNYTAKNILSKSGFFTKLYFEESDEYVLGRENSICTHGNKNIEQVLTAQIIEDSSETIWGDKMRCPGIQKTLIELMQNTREHADLSTPGQYHWWLSINKDKVNKTVKFSFIDYGVGIFTSLDSKSKGSKFHNWRERLKRGFGLLSDSEALKKILEGELHATISSQPHRGRGLPGIRQASERNQLSNLHIITNNVSADVTNENYIDLGLSFKGTFIYFELSSENQHFEL